jgi:hypothetical protein
MVIFTDDIVMVISGGGPDTGFAGYLKKIRPDTGYFINLNT